MKWILISTLVFSSSAFAQSAKDSQVVATIGSKKITLGEFNKKYSEVTTQVLSNPPTKKQLLEELVRYEIGVQEARKRGYEKDPVVQEHLNQELYKALLEKELGKKVEQSTVTESEMKSWYADNPQIKVSDILIEVKTDANEAQRNEAKKRATQILSEVRSSKRSFDELVRLYSDDLTTKTLGGDIGWQSKISLVPNYYAAANSLSVGEVSSSLIETPFGYHIIKLTGKRSYAEATKREIRMAVFDVKRKTLFDKFFVDLKKKYPVSTNPAAVE